MLFQQLVGVVGLSLLLYLFLRLYMANRTEDRRRKALPTEERKRLEDEETKLMQEYGF